MLAWNAASQPPCSFTSCLSSSLVHSRILYQQIHLWECHIQKLGVTADITSHNILLKSCRLAGKVEIARDIYREIRKLESSGALKLDVFTYSTMIKVFADAKMWKRALEIKEDMVSSGVIPDTVTWSSLISACANAGLVEQSMNLFGEMLQSGCEPNSHQRPSSLCTFDPHFSAGSNGFFKQKSYEN
ncbi:UNVERIFIED_CONTAM: Pentatricopeptide repeat-containing protein, chloroplastic [Sesamum calycinum]|uniref:Pentatricopeptide repeat-containing protein, chloroplastic n=1 Tax=Sesamum calycinum TaxID=2727403 RepID=A0AAW2NVL1_9LAMI